MLGLKVDYAHAEQVKRYLQQHDLFDKGYAPRKRPDCIVFPVSREFSGPFDFDVDFIEIEGEERLPSRSLKEILAEYLTAEEFEHLATSFDTVGSIAIVTIRPELEPKEKLVAAALMEANPNIQTVLKKVGGRGGEFRTQTLELVAGVDTRETSVVENGVRLVVNVEDAYYSVRMATERKRILDMIKPGENILCLFSGVGPYPVLFSKKSEAAGIVGIEINPAAHELAVQNVAKNRCTNVRLVCGDAAQVMPKLLANGERFDRVTMPLPHAAEDFLAQAIAIASPGATIHYYTFAPEGTFIQELEKARAMAPNRIKDATIVKVGQHAPRIWRICIDLRV